MTNSNNDNICCKCYINLFNIVPVEMGSSRQFSVIAMAINNLLTTYKKIIKKITYFHSHNPELMNLICQ